MSAGEETAPRRHGSGQAYRKDLDGIRGFAAIVVVLCHAHVALVQGGVVAVDTFFVISGYLITPQVLGAREQPWLKHTAAFYARRARRIIPGLVLMLALTLLAALFLLLPYGEQQRMAWNGISAAALATNQYLRVLKTAYGSSPSDYFPYLHTWSVSIEEQFYFLLPLVVGMFGWIVLRSRRYKVAAISAVMLVSFAVAARSVQIDSYNGYISTFNRVWEFALGALLSQFSFRRLPRAGALVLSFIGAALLAYATVTYSLQTLIPGFPALAPTLATALLVIAGESADYVTPVKRLLMNPVLVYTARVSYAWYLWHWPFLAFTRQLTLNSDAVVRDVFVCGIAYVVAMASTHFIEEPIRFKRVRLGRLSDAQTIGLAAAASIVIVCSCLLLGLQARRRFRVDMLADTAACFQARSAADAKSCPLNEGGQGLVLLSGDSRAAHWAPMIEEWARSRKVTATMRSLPACSMLLAAGIDTVSLHQAEEIVPQGCTALSRAVIGDAIAERKRTENVLLIYDLVHVDEFANSSAVWHSADSVLTVLGDAGVKVLIIGATPEFPYAVPRCLVTKGKDCRVLRSSGLAAPDVQRKTEALLAHHPGIHFWSPAAVYCDAVWCRPDHNGVALFTDELHLSRQGAQWALPYAKPALDAAFGYTASELRN